MRIELSICMFVFRITSGPRMTICPQSKYFNPSPTRLFKLPTVLRCWPWCCSYFVWPYGFYYKAFHVESCLALCSQVFSVLFSITITSLWEDCAGRYPSRVFVCLSCMRYFLSLFSSSSCRGLAAACYCDTPWTFHLTF